MGFKKLRIGLVGGGEGSFIGAIHRMGMRLDDKYDICAGALNSTLEASKKSGDSLGLNPERVYGSVEEMISSEAKRADGIEVVSIVTPNHLHFSAAKKALEAGLHVVMDKPLCLNIEEARELREILKKSKAKFALTYTYAGYPAIIEAKAIITSGRLGKLRKVVVQYPQGWLGEKIEDKDQKQASWRTDPKRAGKSCCFADIGSHAVQMAENICGQRVTEVLAEFHSYVEGRALDDDATVLLRFEKGLRGVAMASQVSSGDNNDLKISIYGEKGGLHWSHENHNQIQLRWTDRPREILDMGADKTYLSVDTRMFLRAPAGHPEGFIEAFANIYKSFAENIRSGKPYLFADIHDGFSGMAVVEAAFASSLSGSVWTKVEE